ncbi:hypothetical protein VCB98_07550 [Gammaproteobacteria bacterium AB-CW1]|uniref:DUF2946 domain-containing protein n=1 Tax=Natronospira elongata TaxID=3110268 RepID=A0AAP6JGG0_9GAMM|nr:hypothetical protein [Gammaproteobacteria bacterium AB-CW1]
MTIRMSHSLMRTAWLLALVAGLLLPLSETLHAQEHVGEPGHAVEHCLSCQLLSPKSGPLPVAEFTVAMPQMAVSGLNSPVESGRVQSIPDYAIAVRAPPGI